jgi:hypothetical protein
MPIEGLIKKIKDLHMHSVSRYPRGDYRDHIVVSHLAQIDSVIRLFPATARKSQKTCCFGLANRHLHVVRPIECIQS